MAADNIIPFEIFEERTRGLAKPPARTEIEPVVIDLEAFRDAQALDIVRDGLLQEQKSPLARIGLDLTEFKQRVYGGNYRVDPEDLAETILDSILLLK